MGTRMKRTGFHPLFLAGLIGSFIFGSSFFVDLIKVYWTPEKMSLNIEDTGNTFQLFIHKKDLKKLVSGGSLSIVEEDGVSKPVRTGDIKIRLNNWYEQKSSILGRAVFTGFFFGCSISMLIIGAIINRKQSPEKIQ